VSLHLPPIFFVLATSECFVIWNTTSCFCDCLPPAFSSLQSPSYFVAPPTVRIVCVWFFDHLPVASTRRVGTSCVVLEIDFFSVFCCASWFDWKLFGVLTVVLTWFVFECIKNMRAGCVYKDLRYWFVGDWLVVSSDYSLGFRGSTRY
jgi:hypothetical protein